MAGSISQLTANLVLYSTYSLSPEHTDPSTTCISTAKLPNCVHKNKDRNRAKQFSAKALATSMAPSSNIRTIWSDASLLKSGSHHNAAPSSGGPSAHGGIAVAQLHHVHGPMAKPHWTVQSSHVSGIADINLLETLAIAAALNTALEGSTDRERVMIFSDSKTALSYVESCVVGIPQCQQDGNTSSKNQIKGTVTNGVDKATQRLSSATQGYGLMGTGRSLKHCQRRAILKILYDAYYRLAQRGAAVEFHVSDFKYSLVFLVFTRKSDFFSPSSSQRYISKQATLVSMCSLNNPKYLSLITAPYHRTRLNKAQLQNYLET